MSHQLTAGRRAATDRRHHKVQAAIADTISTGGDLSVSAVARAAGVDRTFFYRHREFLAQLHLAQTTTTRSTSAPVSNSSIIADLANANARNNRLTERIRALEKKMSETLGEKVWQDSGLGAPANAESLQITLNHRDQQIVDLRRQLDERDQELVAARLANRELMAALNRPPRTR